MNENKVRCHKWRLNNGREKWVLMTYHVYPDLGPKGTPGRGPYCINQENVKAKDRSRYKKALDRCGSEPVEKYR